MNDGTTCTYADTPGSTYGDDTYGLCTRASRRACVTVAAPVTATPGMDPCGMMDEDEGCN